MLNRRSEVEAQFKYLKEKLQTLVETARDNSNPKFMCEVRQRSFMNIVSEYTDEIVLLEQRAKAAKKIIEQQNRTIAALSVVTAASPTMPTASGKKLEVALSEYLRFKRGDWKGRSYQQNVAKLTRFLQIVGSDLLCNQLSGDNISEYLEISKNLPKNAGRILKEELSTSPKSDHRSLWLALSKKNKGDTLSLKAVERHCVTIKGFLKRLHQLGELDNDYCAHLAISKVAIRKTSVKRGAYSLSDINSILKSYIYSNKLRRAEKPKSYHFWAPLIALTTGMRVAEIAALEVSDIKIIDGIWCFDINENWQCARLQKQGFDKTKKTSQSLRIIPIPDNLLNAGLMDFIGTRKSGLLFDDLKLNKSKGLGNEISKWYNEAFVKYADIPKVNKDNEQLVFHSFRHTFTTLLDQVEVGGLLIKESEGNALTGHGSDSVRQRTYVHKHNVAYAKRYIDELYRSVDMTHLSYKTYLSRAKVQ